MTEFERKRQEAKERARLAREKGNNLAKLMEFKKRLAGGGAGAASTPAEVVAALPDGKRPKSATVRRRPVWMFNTRQIYLEFTLWVRHPAMLRH